MCFMYMMLIIIHGGKKEREREREKERKLLINFCEIPAVLFLKLSIKLDLIF